jgi:putative FmdB family regulatory protein
MVIVCVAMPTYEYRCNGCGHELEAFQKISEPALRECPACGKPELERLISASAFQLKGGGWHKDGYSVKSTRTEKQVTDRLQKAINDSKKSS